MSRYYDNLIFMKMRNVPNLVKNNKINTNFSDLD